MFKIRFPLLIVALLIPLWSTATILPQPNLSYYGNQPQCSRMDYIIIKKPLVYSQGQQKYLLSQRDFQVEKNGKLYNKDNTIFVIQYNFQLTENITIPSNCILQFEGGSICSGGKGKNTIKGNKTYVKTDLVRIFDENLIIDGTWSILNWKLEWFGNCKNGSDISKMLESCLQQPAINCIEVPRGWFLLANTVIIPANKTLKMQGHRKRYMLDATDVAPDETRIISSGITNGYMFDVRSKSSIVGGAIIPGKDMTAGGCILCNIGKYRISSIYLNTDLCVYDTKKHLSNNLNAIYINGNYSIGGDNNPCGENFTFDVNITGFKNAIYLERLNETKAPQLVWFNNFTVTGWMAMCQRYMYSNCNTENHAGGSGNMSFSIQGSVVNDPYTPAIEWGGEQNVFDITFHDIGYNQSHKIRYKVKGNHCYFRRQKCDASVILTNYGLWNAFEEGPVIQELRFLDPSCHNSIQFLDGYIEHSGHKHSIYLRCRINGNYKKEQLLRLPHKSKTVVYSDCFAESRHCICLVEGNGLYLIGEAYNSILNIKIDYVDSDI